jgi:ribosome-binding factor A
MPSRRLLKAAEAIREVVSMAILTELRDPRVKNVTVTSVEVLPDMKQARVYVTIMGDEKQQKLTLHGLQNSAGFLQHKIADRIETRYTPRLEFVFDEGVKNALEIDRILKRVLPKDSASADDARDLTIAEDDGDEPAGTPEAFAGDSGASDEEGAPDDTATPEVADAGESSPRDPPADETK